MMFYLYGANGQHLYSMARDVMLGGWGAVSGRYNAEPANNYAQKDIDDVLNIVSDPRTPSGVKERLYGMINCDTAVALPLDMYPYLAANIPVPVVYRYQRKVLPRAFVVGTVRVLEDRESVFRALVSPDIDFAAAALTDKAGAGGDDFSDLQSVSHPRYTVSDLLYGHDTLRVTVNSSAKGMLVVSDTCYPGWIAWLNGTRVPIYKVNGAFRGVRIPGGESTVVMHYCPVSFKWGAVISVLGGGLLLGVFIWCCRRDRCAVVKKRDSR